MIVIFVIHRKIMNSWKVVLKIAKGILNKLFKSNQQSTQSAVKHISPAEVEALVDAKLKAHAEVQNTAPNDKQKHSADQDDITLTAKQIEYALSLIYKVKDDYVLGIDPSKLTIKDLNRLIAFQRYKNKRTLVNLLKKGVLKRN